MVKIVKKMKSEITKLYDISAYRMFNLVRISIFWSKRCFDRLPSQNHGSIKTIKQRGNPDFFFQNPYFAHNSTPVGANVCEIKTTPHIRSFSRCSFRQTAISGGSDGRIEPNYFLYRHVNFLTEKNRFFFV